MTRYLLSKLLQSIITIALVLLVMFTLLRFMPTSGYFTKEQWKEYNDAQKTAYLNNLGVNDPMLTQLGRFLGILFKGDLGRSMTLYPNSQIKNILGDKMGYSIMFNSFSWLISAVIGLPLGIAMARRKGGASWMAWAQRML